MSLHSKDKPGNTELPFLGEFYVTPDPMFPLKMDFRLCRFCHGYKDEHLEHNGQLKCLFEHTSYEPA